MKKDQLYAVVDIEATGASIGRDERMIQFACVLIKNNQVVESFDTFVNPSRKVNKTIRDLTGISSKDLATAPYFEDIAHIIHTLLEDTIFVAHNVAFDFHFLNECFKRVGEAPLTIPAIDTVELAQILYPTEESYQLKDLVGSLGYTLNQAHNALFDAQATAFLLQKLDEKINRLPLITVESLSDLSASLTADTGVFIQHVLEDMKEQPSDLNEDIVIVHGLALKKPVYLEEQEQFRGASSYPYKELEKERVMADLSLHKRENQFTMMNVVFDYLKQKAPNYTQFIEAAPGSGKTFGYLFPSVYVASKENKIVLSTYTKVLQKQIVDEAIPLLNASLPFQRTAALLKSVSHYLSLSAFYTKWKQVSPSDIEAFFCMKILVWLTETDEGDLEEIGVGSRLLHHFWQEIKSPYSSLSSSVDFEAFDYLSRRDKRIEQASILVSNHAYLLNEWRNQSDTTLSSTLILDEAHHVPDVIEESATVAFHSKRVLSSLKKMGSQTKEDSILFQLHALETSHIKPYQLATLESVVNVLLEELDEWIAKWINWMMTTGQVDQDILEWKEESLNFTQVSIDIKRDTKFIKQSLSELLYVGKQLLQTLESNELNKAERKSVKQLKGTLEIIENETVLFDYVFFERTDNSQTGVRFYSKNPTQTLSFMKYNQEKKEDMLETLKKHSHVLLTSSTLAVNGSVRYMQKALDLEEAECVIFDSPYNYEEQGRLFVPLEDSIQASKRGLKPYASYLAEQIEQLVHKTDENCLVLFRSQEVIQEVYRLLTKRHSLQNKTILAQYVSGTPTKISKLFKKASQSIVLGSDSFWEGVDFPEDELKVVIITRLPFDSPEMPLVKKRHKELLDRGDNPFVHDLLPRAVVKFKQGIGRLIRSPKDKGVWVVLDRRMVDASYASVFLDSLPEKLKVEERPIKEIAQEIQTFLNE